MSEPDLAPTCSYGTRKVTKLSTAPGKQTATRIRTPAKAGKRVTVMAVLVSVALASVKVVAGEVLCQGRFF